MLRFRTALVGMLSRASSLRRFYARCLGLYTMPAEPKTETEQVRDVVWREFKTLLPSMKLQEIDGTWKRSGHVMQVVPDAD